MVSIQEETSAVFGLIAPKREPPPLGSFKRQQPSPCSGDGGAGTVGQSPSGGPVPFVKLLRSFRSLALAADPFLLSAWQQVQRYMVDIVHRYPPLQDILNLNFT